MTEARGLPYPQWQIPAQDVLLETNREELPRKVQEAESAIFERLQQLQHPNDGREELDALDHALALIRSVRQIRLGS
jgi:hypothetical protein